MTPLARARPLALIPLLTLVALGAGGPGCGAARPGLASTPPPVHLPLTVFPALSGGPGLCPGAQPPLICEETRLLAHDLSLGASTVVHDFAGQRLAAVWTRHEGNPSLDGRYWGLMAEDENWDAVALLVDESQEHDYWAEPHATANRDLTRILFTTN